MKNTSTQAEVRRAFTWIERFALPLTISVMEAQPIALVIALLTVLVAGPKATPPIGAGEIALVSLGLLWWAMIVENIVRSRSIGRQAIWLYILGWLLAFIAVVGPFLPSLGKLENIFAVLLGTVLVTWLWRRSMRRAQLGFACGELATSFKVAFGVVLGILLIAIVFPELQLLRDALANALPIFFLSGLITLSLVRLGTIRNTHRALDGSMQADPCICARTLRRHASDDHQRTHLRNLVPGLIARLTGRASTRASSSRRTDKQRAGKHTDI
jgi:hypothetical protein